jgi:hypothetical protein
MEAAPVTIEPVLTSVHTTGDAQGKPQKSDKGSHDLDMVCYGCKGSGRADFEERSSLAACFQSDAFIGI